MRETLEMVRDMAEEYIIITLVTDMKENIDRIKGLAREFYIL